VETQLIVWALLWISIFLCSKSREVDICRIHSEGLKDGDALLPLLLNVALEYAIKKVQECQERFKLNGMYHLLVCADEIILMNKNVQNKERNV
jgi:hypothetical protein